MLHHVAYIEKGGMAARKVMRLADTLGSVLNWHVEAAKWDHFSAVGKVQVVEGCLLEAGDTGFGG